MGRASRWIVVTMGAFIAGAVAAACGLDEGGGAVTANGADAAGGDGFASDGGAFPGVIVDAADVFVPPTCATIDASCLGTPVPAGWALLGVASGTQACPSADFDPVPLVENPRLAAGACTCGACAAQGSYACPSVSMKFGAGCGSNAIVQQTSSPCLAHSETGGNARVSAVPSNPVPTGVTCTISATGSGAAATDALSGCRPNKCAADFCGLTGKGFKTCIVQDNVVACPSGFTLRGYAGGGAAASCAGCTCTNPDAKCTGVIRVFDNVGNCDGNGGTGGSDYKGTFGADGGCNDPNSNFDSIFYVPGPAPIPTCAPAAPTAGTGDAGLLSIKTLCCAP